MKLDTEMVTCLTVEETEAMVGLDSGDVIVVGIREGSLCLSGHWVAPPSAASAIQRLLIVGEMVCAFSVDGAIQVWWRSGGTHLWSLPGPEELLCWAVQLSPQKPWTETGDTIYCVDADRFMIVAAGSSSDVLVWDWTGQHLHSLTGQLGVVRHLHIKPSPAARPCLVSAGDMRRIIVWRPDLAPPDHVLHRNPAQVGTFLLNDFYIIVSAHSGTPGFVLLSFI